MKKMMLFLLLSLLATLLAACGGESAPATTEAAQGTASAPITSGALDTSVSISLATTAPATTAVVPAETTPVVTTPMVTTPAVTTPAATTPAVTTPAVTTPAVTTPAVTTPAVTTPAMTTSVLTTPETTIPETTTPETTAPETTAPETTVPETTVPVTTLPETTAAPITYTASNWMSAIPDKTSLNNIAIPGTHDSGAMHDMVLAGTAKCQSLTIAEQLTAGVRFFDIRLRRVNGALHVYHGEVDQKLTFDEVLSACYAFLAENPSEALIVCIKEEAAAEGTNGAFDAMVASKINENAGKWFTGGGIPQLKQVRGKIVLMRRYGTSGTFGFNASSGWADNSKSFTLTSGSYRLSVQDFYQNNSADEKWDAISKFFGTMKYQNNTYYMNFTSGYVPSLFSIPNINKIADAINPKLLEYFAVSPDIVGIVVTDFVTSELAQAIYEVNFN